MITIVEKTEPNVYPCDLHLTEAAVSYVLAQQKKHPGGKGIQLGLSKTGCSGYAYSREWVTQQPENTTVVAITDECFFYVEHSVCDKINGTTVDLIKQGLNVQLVFTNPKQSGVCGCGESFTF